ncbi:MAG TPA: hypothetical protein VGN11_10995, partial [Candidatus Baltobacteraceae bacterium]|nr:hypothetical protein [Candidatus Baltobacteraceae bacterium]
LISTDITVLSRVLFGVRAFINPGRPSPFSYVEGSKIVMVAVIMGVAVVPDAFLFWLLLPHALWWLALALNLLDIWACLWFFGLYGTMVRRPHEVSPERIVLRNGILQTVEIDPGGIEDVRELGIVKRWKLPRRRGEASAVLGLGGVAMVAIRLAEPAFERRAFFPRPRKIREVFVASDAPAAFCSALRELAPARLSVR